MEDGDAGTKMALSLLAAIVESSDDAIIGMDLNGIIFTWNKGAEIIFSHTAGEMVGTSIMRLIPADRQDEERQIQQKIKRAERVNHFETLRQAKDGRLIHVSITASPIRDGGGKVIGVSKVARNITQQKTNERELVRLSRLYAALSQINQAIVWTPRRDELFEKICRVLVEFGGFRMAWIGQPEVETRRVLPVARWGDDTDYLTRVTIYADDRPEGRGSVGMAIREGRNYICNDFFRDPNTRPWHEPARQAGFQSYAAFLIRQGGVVWGALTVYSIETGFFRDKEIALLEEAATDVSFALDNLAREVARQQAAEKLQESEERYRTLFDSANDGIMLLSAEGRILAVSESFARQHGYSKDELLRMSLEDLDTSETFQRVPEQIRRQLAGECFSFEVAHRHKDGRVLQFEVSASPISLDGEKVIQAFHRDITERRQAEREIQRQAAFAQFNPNPVLELSATGEVLYYNAAALQMANSFGQEHPGTIMPAHTAAIVRDCLATGHPHRCLELPINDRIISWSFFPITQNQVVHCYAGDITDRKRAEADLQQSEERFQLSMEATNDGLWDWNIKTDECYFSPAYYRMLGYAPGDLQPCGKTWAGLIHPDDRERALKANRDCIQGRCERFEVRFRMKTKDGSWRWILGRGKCIARDKLGQAFRLVGTHVDITESKQTEETNAQLALAVEQSAETIVITDADGIILYVNPAFEKTSGYSRAEALGQNPRIFKSGKQDAKFYHRMWSVLKFGEVWSGHFINQRKNGQFYEEEATISPVRDAHGTIVNYVAVKRDVTREVQLESQFRQSQKMEAFGQLAGGVAHDFNNILAVIQMQAGLLKLEPKLTLEQIDFAGEIEKSAQRGANLTRQLLLFSRKQTMQLQNLKLNETLENIAKMLQRTLGEQFRLHFKLSEELLVIHADAGMIDQILLNLTVNARDAMPAGGQIRIETSAAEFDEIMASQTVEARPGSFVCLSVTDGGCGIPPEILPRIFEPFFTTKEVGKGTGLGLATVFGIVHQHKGWINVDSKVGAGTTFRIYLPRLSETSDTKFYWPSLASIRGGDETILVAEDDAALRATVRTTLSHLGYCVLEAASGDEAEGVWQQHHDQIRLLLTDLVMPGQINGLQLAHRLLQQDPKLKVIYVSGYSTEIAGENFLQNAGVNFLAKPFQLQKLAQIIRDNLDKPAKEMENR